MSELTPEQLEAMRAENRRNIKERFEQLPASSLPVRENTIMTYPSHDFRIDVETHKGLIQCAAWWVGELTINGFSDVGLARNSIFNAFLRTPYEWLLGVDTDIGFGSDEIIELLEWKGPQDYAVHGCYSKKNEKRDSVTQGLGFFRIHRSVLEAIKLHIPLRFMRDGNEMQDFCFSGVSEKMGLLREDTGFWFLCSQVGVKPRLIAPNLRHYGGRRAYELSETTKRFIERDSNE